MMASSAKMIKNYKNRKKKTTVQGKIKLKKKQG